MLKHEKLINVLSVVVVVRATAYEFSLPYAELHQKCFLFLDHFLGDTDTKKNMAGASKTLSITTKL